MIKEIKTEKFEGLAVLVPDDAEDFDRECVSDEDFFQLNYLMINNDEESGFHGEPTVYSIDMPCNFEIIGKSTELTEEQCADIVGLSFGVNNIYKSYEDITAVDTAKESFASLMQSIGAYSVNPYPKPDINSEKYVPISDDAKDTLFMNDWDQWETAQEHTGTWLILKRI